jgi:adenine-specific DNA-methyltransferase
MTSNHPNLLLDLNKEDEGKRKFIMVQFPERCEDNSEAKKAGYDTIADIGKERIRRVIQKIQRELDEKEQENQSKIPELRDEISQLDLGFKVLKLNASNFNTWQGNDPEIEEGELIKQLELHIDHIKPTATQEDILYELLLKSGFMPTEKVKP